LLHDFKFVYPPAVILCTFMEWILSIVQRTNVNGIYSQEDIVNLQLKYSHCLFDAAVL